MDTLYGTLLHASTLIRNFIERNVPPREIDRARKSSPVVAICQVLIKTEIESSGVESSQSVAARRGG